MERRLRVYTTFDRAAAPAVGGSPVRDGLAALRRRSAGNALGLRVEARDRPGSERVAIVKPQARRADALAAAKARRPDATPISLQPAVSGADPDTTDRIRAAIQAPPVG